MDYMAKNRRDDNDPTSELVAGALDALEQDVDQAEDPDAYYAEADPDALEGELLDPDDEDEDGGADDEVPDDLVFTTDENTDEDEDEDTDELVLKLDGRTLRARKPGKGAWSVLLGSVSRSATAADKTQAILNFVYASFDEPSRIIIDQRLIDRSDRFDIRDISKMVSALIERWAPEETRQTRAQRRRAKTVMRDKQDRGLSRAMPIGKERRLPARNKR